MSSLGGQHLPGDVSDQLGRAFTQIGEAQTLDCNGDELGAYRHYLSSVALTMQILSADIQANQGQGTLPVQKVKQLFKMASHCLERGEDIFTTARKEQRPLALFRLATPSPISSPTLSTPPISQATNLSHSAVPSSSALASASTNVPRESSPNRSRSSTFSGPFSGPSNSKVAHKMAALPNRTTLPPQTSSSGKAGAAVSSSSMSKTATWMSSQRAKLQGIPLLGRRNGADSVDGPQQPSAGQRSTSGAAVCPPGQSSRGSGEGSVSQTQTTNTIHAMSYREEAELRNRHVMEQYKALLRKQHSSGSTGTPVSNEARLSMLRRLEENLSVARIREENISRRLKEKKMRDEAKAKPTVSFSSLSVDELCDHVTSFEHGKPQISVLKARLNSSDSDPSIVYSAISEILSIVDHPLSRLLGEYQYTVVMTLQPVVSAVEKAGGLPRVDIWLDTDNGKGSSHSDSRGGEGGRGYNTDAVGYEDDDLLKMLSEEDDDAFSPLSPPGEPEPEKDAFDEKLERLKRELTQPAATEGSRYEAEAKNGNLQSRYSNGDYMYENTRKSNPDSRVYQNTMESLEDMELSNAPVFDSEDSMYENTKASGSNMSGEGNIYTDLPEPRSEVKRNECYGTLPAISNVDHYDVPRPNPRPLDKAARSIIERDRDIYTDLPEPRFDVNRNESYGTLPAISKVDHYDVPRPNPRPLDEAARSIIERDRDVYEDLDNISKMLQENKVSGREDVDSHHYEAMDSVWGGIRDAPERQGQESAGGTSNGASHIYESTDGGMLSQPEEVPTRPEEIEMEKLVIFKNLPPLVGSTYTGDAVTLGKLSDTASSVLTEVVKQVQKSFKVLQQCFSSCYPILSSEENQEMCHSVLEASFFPAIISLLTTVYRCKNYRDEVAIANNMFLHVNASPKDLAVRDKYWLIEQMYAPYGEAIDEVRRVPTYQYPSSKLECIVRMSKRVVKCIEEYSKRHHPDKKIDLVGVDDMLPIISFVILRSGMPQLISECSIMEEFIQEGYIMGEEGFCLTSFLTALRYLINMSAQNS